MVQQHILLLLLLLLPQLLFLFTNARTSVISVSSRFYISILHYNRLVPPATASTAAATAAAAAAFTHTAAATPNCCRYRWWRRSRIQRTVQRETQAERIQPHDIVHHLAGYTSTSAVQPPFARQLSSQRHCLLAIRANARLPRPNLTVGRKRQRQSDGQTLHGRR
jgi:hypothetical protein